MRPTIVACASPWGWGAVSLVRLSGASVREVIGAVCVLPRGMLPHPRRVVLVRLRDHEGEFDEALLTFMPSPASYTGEDVAEISCHGNPLLVERLIAACVEAGCRPALPGEFTRRAFENGRIDLTRAEAVLQTIEASTRRGLDVARAGLSGDVARWVDALRRRLREVAADLEAVLDHPEAIGEAPGSAVAQLTAIASEASRSAASFQAGRSLLAGARVALVGPVNAGKSSLFNALLGQKRAIVDPRPGTTRDVIESRTVVGDVAITLLDTAGERSTDDDVEQQGLRLRDSMLADCDLLLVVLPAHRLDEPPVQRLLDATEGRSRILVGNHADRAGARQHAGAHALLPTCAVTGAGLAELKVAIRERLVQDEPREGALLIASQRQRDVLHDVARHARAAAAAVDGVAGPAVAALETHLALSRLDEMDGADTREEVLQSLFSRFCIGK